MAQQVRSQLDQSCWQLFCLSKLWLQFHFEEKKGKKDVSYLFFQSTRNDSQTQKLTRMLLAIGRYFMIYS